MSNQFYNYISTLLLSYFEKNINRPGDRFVLQLGNKDEITGLVNALWHNQKYKKSDFVYKLANEENYETFYVKLPNTKLIVASTINDVKPDFLVTLRNLVGEQKGIFNGTSLISLLSDELDSVLGGSGDLQKEGMPLHPDQIYYHLERVIKNSNLSYKDENILLETLENLIKTKDIEEINFFDFEEVFATLENGKIEQGDFYKFGLFYDNELETYRGKSFKQRIEKNRELFSTVKSVHDYGLNKDELEKTFGNDGANFLNKDDWFEKDFTDVFKYNQRNIEFNKKKKVEIQNVRVLGNVPHWQRTAGSTAAQKRKHHIVIFSESYDEIVIQVSFSFQGEVRSLSKEFVKQIGDSDTLVEVKSSNIFIRIKPNSVKAPITSIKYKHEGRVALGGEINLIVVPFEEVFLEGFKERYLVNNKTGLELQFEKEEIVLGDKIFNKTLTIEENNMETTITEDNRLTINFSPDLFYEDNKVTLNLIYNNKKTPLTFVNELPAPHPLQNRKIWDLIRVNKADMQWLRDEERIIFNNNEYYLYSIYKYFFEWEYIWIKNGFKSAVNNSGELMETDITISPELKKKYYNVISYFKTHPFEYAIPSLCYVSDDFLKLANDYIEEYINEIDKFNEENPAGKKGADLFKLGLIYSGNTIYMTPFHPLPIAYKLKAYELLNTESIDTSILKRLNPESLIPYIYGAQDVLYKPEFQQDIMEWIIFKPSSKVSVSDSSNYLSHIVKDKLLQFKEHFRYLFIHNSEAPMLINVINISNDGEILSGILNWLIHEIHNNDINSINPIEITLYQVNSHIQSSFDLFTSKDSVEEIEELFNINLTVKNQMEKEEVLRIMRDKIKFFKQSISDKFNYAHLTFYNMHASSQTSSRLMNTIDTGLSIDGVYSNIPSMRENKDYLSGFGVKAYEVFEDNQLINLAYHLNELALNSKNNGSDVFRKGQAIFSQITNEDNKNILKNILKSSNWLIFVDPHFDLEFLNEFEEMLVIHYSDQYTSSNKYDAITVTDKYSQYYSVIQNFLYEKGIEADSNQVISTIKAFNTFNGEWLLRIIGSRGYYDREKLSMISAIKYALSFFNHDNILWVPISMEEILRVAGVVGLDKTSGIFTSKNIGVKGNLSDDLLLIGLEELDEKLYLHFYPIEVKTGLNNTSTIKKAIEQVSSTKNNIITQLTGGSGKAFSSLFYRNFFVQLFLSNAKRMAQNKIWPKKNYNVSDKVIEKLLKDDYEIEDTLREYMGDGGVISFKKDIFYRSQTIDQGILILQFQFDDIYTGLIRSADWINDWLHKGSNDFIHEKMLARAYGESRWIRKTEEFIEKENTEDKDQNLIISPVIENKKENKDKPKESSSQKNGSVEKTDIGITKTFKSQNLEEARIKLGKIENSNKEIFWEYGHQSLANRHMLISGKSGQGKTYFMQCILLEKSKLGIPSIVVDYTEGFLPNQLEPVFQEYLGEKVIQKIVSSDKLPINPFQKNVKNLGGIEIEETSIDIAERIKGVFSSVYTTLGIQQLNAIYESIIEGVDLYGRSMNLNRLKEILEDSDSNYAKTALSQIRPFIDRNPFDHKSTIDWNNILNSDGSIYIIQLAGYSRDVQMMITEFILWDLWNHSVKYGSKNKPIPIILDEAQNLDHSANSPSARILTEGRKFGWSAWNATQFLRSQLSRDELSRLQNSSQKIYFAPPEEEISHIASTFTRDNNERKYWEEKLSSLKKGQCIVHAPILKSNGELSSQAPFIVNISSLEDRI